MIQKSKWYHILQGHSQTKTLQYRGNVRGTSSFSLTLYMLSQQNNMNLTTRFCVRFATVQYRNKCPTHTQEARNFFAYTHLIMRVSTCGCLLLLFIPTLLCVSLFCKTKDMQHFITRQRLNEYLRYGLPSTKRADHFLSP